MLLLEVRYIFPKILYQNHLVASKKPVRCKRLTKSSYEIELRKMKSQRELLTPPVFFFFFFFFFFGNSFELLTPKFKSRKIHFVLQTRWLNSYFSTLELLVEK